MAAAAALCLSLKPEVTGHSDVCGEREHGWTLNQTSVGSNSGSGTYSDLVPELNSDNYLPRLLWQWMGLQWRWGPSALSCGDWNIPSLLPVTVSVSWGEGDVGSPELSKCDPLGIRVIWAILLTLK